jgi:nitroreductase
MLEDLKEIIRLGTLAPSGDNSQPWKFIITGNRITVLNRPERDLSLYNFNQNATLIAHGCLIENIKIAAAAKNYEITIINFPDRDNTNIISHIDFKKNIVNKEARELLPYLYKRSSNRKKYHDQKISEEKIAQLLASASSFSDLKLKIVTDPNQINRLATALSKNEKVLLENKEMHHTLFYHITWNKRDDNENHGFFLPTFEFNLPQRIVFRLLSHWPVMSFFNKFHVANSIAKENEKIFQTSAAICAITTTSSKAQNYLSSGMLLERVWLEATKLGLSVQPTTGIVFLMQRIKAGNVSSLSLKQQELIRTEYAIIGDTFETHDDTITMVFRLGYAESPSGRTSRFAPIITIVN